MNPFVHAVRTPGAHQANREDAVSSSFFSRPVAGPVGLLPAQRIWEVVTGSLEFSVATELGEVAFCRLVIAWLQEDLFPIFRVVLRGRGQGWIPTRRASRRQSGWRFRTPPGWPEPPAGWRPAPGWAPDPQWPPAPPGWQFWEPDTEHPGSYGATPQAQPPGADPSAAYDAAQAQPIANWAARPRPNQGLGTALLVLGALVLLGDILSAVTAPAAVHAYEAAAAEGRDPAQVLTAYDAVGLLLRPGAPADVDCRLALALPRPENAVLIAPDQIRRSAVWAWLGWWVPVVCFWFPKQIVDDSWRITSSVCRSRPARPLPRHQPCGGCSGLRTAWSGNACRELV